MSVVTRTPDSSTPHKIKRSDRCGSAGVDEPFKFSSLCGYGLVIWSLTLVGIDE